MFVYTKNEAMTNFNKIMELIGAAMQAAEFLHDKNVTLIFIILG